MKNCLSFYLWSERILFQLCNEAGGGRFFGDIYGKAFRRDENEHILYETEGGKKGLPQVEGEGKPD